MPLRADATRNRQAVVDAAHSLFAEHGLSAPLDEIARRAGTGNATLYRRFPTRCALVAAVFADHLAEHVAAVELALQEPEPLEGLRHFLVRVTAMQASDRGLADLVTMEVSAAPEIEGLRRRAFRGLVVLLGKAKGAGTLRADVTPEDVLLLLMANAGLIERAQGCPVTASARLVHLFLDGLRAEAATEGPAPPSASRMRMAVRANGARLRLAEARPLER